MSGGLMQLLESLFRRRFWIVVLLAISLESYLVARGINGIIAGQLAPLTVVSPTGTPPADEPLESDATGREIAALLTPTPDETSAPVAPEEEPDEDLEEEPDEEAFALREGDCQQSSIPAILVGTMVDASGTYSYGIVQDQRANRTSVVYAGMDLAGAEILYVEPQRMWVLNEGREECLKPNEEPSSAPVPVEEVRSSRPSRSSSEPGAAAPRTMDPVDESSGRAPGAYNDVNDLRSGITRVSPTQYEIDRAAVERATDNPRMLQSQAPEFQQNFEDGRPAGIRLTRIPSGSIFSAIGIRQGDVIMEVNGSRVTTTQRAMDLYDALRTEAHVEVVVQRRGRMRTLVYDIR